MDSNNYQSEPVDLLKKLLEQSKYQNQFLGNITNLMEIMLCQLEKISRQTCESVNELHWQTGLQKSLLKDVALLLDIYKSQNPEAVLRINELEELRKKIEECCPDKKEKDKPICCYEPCEKDKKPRTHSNNVDHGKSIPHKVEGAPYKPLGKKDDPNKQPNDRKIRQIPIGPFKGLISETKGSDLKEMGAGDDSPDPVRFSRYTEATIANLASANAADISGGDSGRVVMLSGNWYAQYSTDGGTTFTTVDPTTIFPSGLGGGGAFCCDQIIQYVPSIDRFVWLLQHCGTTAGSCLSSLGGYRLASASPQNIIDSNCTSWTYWDLPASAFGQPSNWVDYPSLSVGNSFLSISADVQSNGLIVIRIPLAEIRDSLTINFDYTNPADSNVAWGSDVSQNTGDEVFWAGHVDNGTIRVFSLREDSNTYFWRDIDVANWSTNTLSSLGPNGNNWFGWGFPTNAIIGITRRANELWLAWTAGNGDGGHGGFNFPNPHVQVVKININNYSLIEQMQIWNPDFAFGYPSFATNSQNEVGITLGWGGGGTLNANSAVGIMGDYVVWFRNGSTWTHTRWGDYVACRQAAPDARLFAGFGFVIYQDTTTTAGHRFDPYYVLFGRQSVITPPIG